MYTVLGATGHIGSIITRVLLSKGEKVRVLGRSASRLQPLVQAGAEASIGEITDLRTLTKALTGVRAAFLMIPPHMTSPDYRAEQEHTSDVLSAAAKNSDLRYAVNLSSIGAQAPSGTGPILGQHSSEQKLNAIDRLNVLHLRPAYFFENHLSAISMIQMMGVFGGALDGELKIPMIATRDIGAYAAKRLLDLDFSGRCSQQLYGQRDLSMYEVAAIVAKALGKPELRYARFPYEQVEQVLIQMGTPVKTAACFIEMFRGINDGIVVGTEPRTEENTTPTTFEQFATEVFVPAYQGKAVGA